MASRAIGVTEEEIKDVERQLKELVESSSKLYLCTDGRFWDYSVFDGMMLSDGYLEKSVKNARFKLSCKHKEFAEIFQKRSGSFPWGSFTEYKYFDKRTNKTYATWKLNSKADERFTKEHERWYPKGKKIVPKDIVLDKTTLIWWYLGDGSLYRKKSRPNYRRVVLSTQGFEQSDIDFLLNKLTALIGNESVHLERKEIVIGGNSLCNFIKIIGTQSPVSCYQYKFDFGPYVDDDYWKKSFENRPLKYINEYRKMNKVRELNYRSKEEINHE